MTADSQREALKPCPFCGSLAAAETHHIECSNIDCFVNPYVCTCEDGDMAVRWNTRAAPPQDAAAQLADAHWQIAELTALISTAEAALRRIQTATDDCGHAYVIAADALSSIEQARE